MKSTAQRSTLGHLFHFYPLLLDIATLPNKPPILWMMPSLNDVGGTLTTQTENPLGNNGDGTTPRIGTILGGKSEPVEVDSRRLAGRCLEILGKEFGRR